MDKKRLLWISDSPALAHVGQSRVTREYCQRLSTDYEVGVVAWNHINSPTSWPYRVFPSNYMKDDQIYSDQWIQCIQEFKPSAVVLSHDVWRYYRLGWGTKTRTSIKSLFPDTSFIGYFTIDGHPVHSSWLPMFECCDVVVVPSKFGRDVIHQRYTQIPVEVIPYGVDLEVFGPVEDKEEFKKQVDKETNEQYKGRAFPIEMSNRFVCCFVGQNQNKKNIAAIYDAFESFAIDKEDVLFVCVTHTRSKAYDTYMLGCDFDLGDLQLLNKASNKIHRVDTILSDTSIARVYKFSDALVFPSIGEAFGLPVLEAMVCGAVPLVTDYSSLPELVNGSRGFKIEVAEFMRSSWNVNRAIVSIEDLKTKLEYAYILWKYNKEMWNKLRDSGVEYSKQFTWDSSYEKLKKVIERVLVKDDFVTLEVEKI